MYNEQIIEEISHNKTEILNDFCKTYIASNIDWFLEDPKRISKLGLIEQKSTDHLKTTYKFVINDDK